MRFLTKAGLFIFLSFSFSSLSFSVYAFDSRGPNIAGISFGESEHEKITEEALGDLGFLHKKIEEIEDANTDVDWKEHSIRWWLIFPVGLKTNKHYNPEHHFDRGRGITSQEAFKEGVKYVHQQKADFKQHFKQCETEKALKALGKALHALQDFFSHSNYVDDPPADKESSKKKWLSDEERKQALEALLDPPKDPPANLELAGYYPNDKKPGNATGDPYPHDTNAKDDKHCQPGKTKFEQAKKAAVDATKKFVETIMQELEAELKEKQKDVWQKKIMELFGSTEVSFSKIFTEEMPATSTPPVKPPEVAPKGSTTSDSGDAGIPAKKTQNGVGNEIIRQPEEVAPNQKPVIKGVTVSQLHFSYNEAPHRYHLTIDVSDPDGNLPLAYTWSISCGYFFGTTNSEAVEWRYDTPGECINARLTIKVADSLGASESLTDYPLF